MKYQVIWGPVVEAQLAAVWIAAPDRSAVTRAVDWLEQRLSRMPLHLGEARESSVHRVAFQSPLGIEYVVIEDDKRVLVQAVFAVE